VKRCSSRKAETPGHRLVSLAGREGFVLVFSFDRGTRGSEEVQEGIDAVLKSMSGL
jgi:hypothetical protein